MSLQDSFFNDNRDNRDNFCDNLFQCEACCLYCLYCRFNHLSCHANIVQRVKNCYKIKIDFRVQVCCFDLIQICFTRF